MARYSESLFIKVMTIAKNLGFSLLELEYTHNDLKETYVIWTTSGDSPLEKFLGIPPNFPRTRLQQELLLLWGDFWYRVNKNETLFLCHYEIVELFLNGKMTDFVQPDYQKLPPKMTFDADNFEQQALKEYILENITRLGAGQPDIFDSKTITEFWNQRYFGPNPGRRFNDRPDVLKEDGFSDDASRLACR